MIPFGIPIWVHDAKTGGLPLPMYRGAAFRFRAGYTLVNPPGSGARKRKAVPPHYLGKGRPPVFAPCTHMGILKGIIPLSRRRQKKSPAQPQTSADAPLERRYFSPRISWMAAMRALVEGSWVVGVAEAWSSGRMVLASCLPSSTPNWSKELMFQMVPWTKILCS